MRATGTRAGTVLSTRIPGRRLVCDNTILTTSTVDTITLCGTRALEHLIYCERVSVQRYCTVLYCSDPYSTSTIVLVPYCCTVRHSSANHSDEKFTNFSRRLGLDFSQYIVIVQYEYISRYSWLCAV